MALSVEVLELVNWRPQKNQMKFKLALLKECLPSNFELELGETPDKELIAAGFSREEISAIRYPGGSPAVKFGKAVPAYRLKGFWGSQPQTTAHQRGDDENQSLHQGPRFD